MSKLLKEIDLKGLNDKQKYEILIRLNGLSNSRQGFINFNGDGSFNYYSDTKNFFRFGYVAINGNNNHYLKLFDNDNNESSMWVSEENFPSESWDK